MIVTFGERLRRCWCAIVRTCWGCGYPLDGEPPSGLCDPCWGILRSGKNPRERALCNAKGHPGSRCCSGPWNGYWTMYCDNCGYWDKEVDEDEYPRNSDGSHSRIG